MTETTEQLVANLGMDDEERDLANTIYQAIQDHSNYSARTLQAKEFKVGISDLGYCSERVRRMLSQEVPDDTDVLAAFLGTAIGDHVEQAVEAKFPDTVRQVEVSVELQGDRGVYTITGHPDLVLPGILVDVKTTRGLAVVRRNGPSQQQQFQRHCYAKGAHAAGLFGDMPLDEVKVANVWVDRSGDEKDVHVQMEPYSEEVVQHAADWLDSVVYDYLHNEESRKEPAREVCAVTCGFFATCRALDTDVEGLLTDQTVLSAVDMYRQGLDMEKQGRKLKDEAKQHLVGIQGTTGDFTVRWVHVNDSIVPESVRRGHDKLDIRAIPKGRRVQGR